MPSLASRVRRAREALHLLASYAADWHSRRVLAVCYATTLSSTTDQREETVSLRIRGRRFTFRMRRSDIFTLGEILCARGGGDAENGGSVN